MRFRYLLYALFVTVVATAMSWGGMVRDTVNSRFSGGSSYSSGHAGGGSWGGGSGGHK